MLQNSYSRPASSWSDMSAPLLRSGYPYAAQGYSDLDDLRAGCYYDGDPNAPFAATTRTNMWDDFITMWFPFFYKSDVVYRAATLLHEARHYRTRGSHTCGDTQDATWTLDYWQRAACPVPVCPSCTGRASCPPCPVEPGCTCESNRAGTFCYKYVVNPNWKTSNEWSVYAIGSAWLRSYWLNADINTNPTMKELARNQGKAIANTKFCNPDSVPDPYKNY